MPTKGFTLAVGATATPVVSGAPQRDVQQYRSAILTNLTADPSATGLPLIYVGGPDVDTTSKYGLTLAPGETISLPYDEDINAIRTSAATLGVLVTGRSL